MSVENHIMKVSFCGKFQKAVKAKKSNDPYCNPYLIVPIFLRSFLLVFILFGANIINI